MLTDLSWLEPGSKFPPASEKERLKMYDTNKKLFESKHVDVYEDDLKRIQRVIGNFQDVISYPVVLNFQKLMSLKIADLLLGEAPQISAGKKDSVEQRSINTIVKNSDLMNTAFQAVIDVSRFGDGLLLIRDGDDNGVIDITQPPLWFPVVAPDNVRDIQYHVLAWTYNEVVGEVTTSYLKVRIHDKGCYEERIYTLLRSTSAQHSISTNVITKLISTDTVKTGLSDFAVIQIPNTITSDRTTGMDDYTDIDSIVGELLVRVAQVSRILDKHASPSMSGPQAALEKDPATGEWRLKAGNYFPRENKDDPNVEYITWDGQLAANFTHIEKLVNFLYTLSEMGSALFGDMSAVAGQIPSGSALKRLMIAPLSKVARIRSRFDPALKKAIMLCSQLGGQDVIDLTNTTISITWSEGIPIDDKEMAETMQLRTGNKPTISQLSAIKKMDDLDDDAADEELSRIQDDESASTPFVVPPVANIPHDNMPGETLGEMK